MKNEPNTQTNISPEAQSVQVDSTPQQPVAVVVSEMQADAASQAYVFVP